MSFIAAEPSNDYDEWTIIDINSIDVVTESVEALHLKDDPCYDREMDNSYIELTAVPHQSGDNDSSDRAVPSNSCSSYFNPTVKSYRQALLTPSTGPSADTAIHRGGPFRAPTANEWKPRIVVDSSIKFERKDRLYHHNLPPQCELLDDEDDFGDMTSPNCYALVLCLTDTRHILFLLDTFYQSIDYIKGSIGVSRIRAVTMLTPKAMEKKLERMSAKGGVTV